MVWKVSEDPWFLTKSNITEEKGKCLITIVIGSCTFLTFEVPHGEDDASYCGSLHYFLKVVQIFSLNFSLYLELSFNTQRWCFVCISHQNSPY